MATHDFMAYPHLSREYRLPCHSACGITCDICGSTFLTRELVRISSLARKQGAMEDPYSWDRILPQGGGLRQEQLRPNIKCTLCFEAHCSQCNEVLHITDYLWDERCCHCGKPSNPYFVQLKAMRPKFRMNSATARAVAECNSYTKDSDSPAKMLHTSSSFTSNAAVVALGLRTRVNSATSTGNHGIPDSSSCRFGLSVPVSNPGHADVRVGSAVSAAMGAAA